MSLCRHDMNPENCADCAPRPTATVIPLDQRHETDFGPWIIAAYYGTCSGCGDDIVPGLHIRADGESGWLCEACGVQAGGLPPAQRATLRGELLGQLFGPDRRMQPVTPGQFFGRELRH